MTEEPSTLYAKLLGETASITWKELEPFFAKGALLWVDPSLDLIAAAEAVATDEGEKVAAWLAEDKVAKLSETLLGYTLSIGKAWHQRGAGN